VHHVAVAWCGGMLLWHVTVDNTVAGEPSLSDGDENPWGTEA
jgi:hypothetical protein